jgi:hypothetical protein
MRFVRALLGIAIVGVFVSAAMPALANAGLHITLTLPSQATAGVAVPFTYTSVGVTAGERLVVQRQLGTGHVYQTVATLRRVRVGHSALAPFPLGVYGLRIAVIAGHRVIPDPPAVMSVFGQVPFTTLFRATQGSSGVFSLPNSTFPYAFNFVQATAPIARVTSTHSWCRSLTFSFVSANATGSNPTETLTMIVVQQSRDPVSASASLGQVQSLTANVVPGESWSLRSSTLPGQSAYYVYVNGYGMCDTRAAFPPVGVNGIPSEN